MFNKLFQITVLSYIWKQNKTIIFTTLSLFIFFWLVGVLHDDYIQYADLNDEKQHIGLSFIIKWVAYIGGFITYIFINNKKRQVEQSENTKAEDLSEFKSTHFSEVVVEESENKDIEPIHSDPFDRIRKKDKLRSKADFVIEKNK